MLIGWLLLQVLPSTPPIAFNLARVTPVERRCGDSAGDEIVVCGSNLSEDRLTVLPPTVIEPMLPKAEVRLLGKATVGLVGGQRVVGGVPSTSIMLTIRMPF